MFDKKIKLLDKKRNLKKERLWELTKYLIISFILSCLMLCISPLKNEFSLGYKSIILLVNSIMLYATSSIFLLFDYGIILYYLYNAIWLILSLVNSILVKTRGTPLTKYDLYMTKEGLELSKEYLSSGDLRNYIFIIMTILLLMFLFIIKSKKSKKINLSNWGISLLLCTCLLNVFSVDTTNKDASDIGFVNYFFNNIKSQDAKKPLNYNKDIIDEIKNNIEDGYNENDKDNKNIKPNIIAVQLESFFDPKTLTSVELNQNPIPYFDELREKFSHGYVNVPAFGGGTIRSEFEFLTAINLDAFTEGVMPNNTFLRHKEVSNIPYLLKNIGYSTHFLHNYIGDFYRRNEAYKSLGFDTFTSQELMPDSSSNPLSIKESKDEVFIRDISNIITNEKDSTFIFAATAQLHSPYDSDDVTNKNDIYATEIYPTRALREVNNYVNEIKTVDDVIKGLVEELETINEPTIAIFYSDHLPYMDLPYGDDLYSVPYVVWDNIGLDRDIKNIELSDLMLDYLVKTNIDIGNLTNLYKKYYGSDKYKEYKELINYDISFGNNYIKEIKFKKNNNMKIGYNDIRVKESTKLSEGKYLIKGEHFTEHIKVVCNNKEYDIEYKTSNEIIINTDDDLTDKKIYLKISIGENNKSIAKSNEFVIEK
ncbi:MAG: LTA synthase family protein [Clostridium sp.]|nr:LTA synthase family protein [Clostridium sp.]